MPARRRVTELPPAPAEVRRWARVNGIKVPPRGRVPESVYEQYRASTS